MIRRGLRGEKKTNLKALFIPKNSLEKKKPNWMWEVGPARAEAENTCVVILIFPGNKIEEKKPIAEGPHHCHHHHSVAVLFLNVLLYFINHPKKSHIFTQYVLIIPILETEKSSPVDSEGLTFLYLVLL